MHLTTFFGVDKFVVGLIEGHEDDENVLGCTLGCLSLV